MRAQAAIEYLTTYGWAIIVLLLMVSALSLLGVVNPREWAPDRCEVGAEFHCVDQVFINDGSQVTLKLMLKNNLRERVILHSINCTFEGGSQMDNDFPDISLGNDEEKEIECTTSESNVVGMDGKIRASFTINYIKRDGLFFHEIQGTAFSQVVLP